MDLRWYAQVHQVPIPEVARVMGLTETQVQRAYDNFARKYATPRYLRLPPAVHRGGGIHHRNQPWAVNRAKTMKHLKPSDTSKEQALPPAESGPADNLPSASRLEGPSSSPAEAAEARNLWTAVGKSIKLPAQSPGLARAAHDDGAPLSFAQQRLWFIHQTEPQSAAYNVICAWQISGPLNLKAFKQSLHAIVQRHESFRTSFVEIETQPVQIVSPLEEIKLALVSLESLPEGERAPEALAQMQQESRRPFDLAQAPLLRALALRLAPEEHCLLLVMHQIAADGVSLNILYRELQAFYRQFVTGRPAPLPELPVQCADYAVWQRQWLQGEVLQAQLTYWKKQLGGRLPVLELPADHPRPARLSSRGALHRFALPSALAAALHAFKRQEGTTLFNVMLAAFKALLFRYTGQEDLVVGLPTANRTRNEIRSLIGFFVNTQVLRTQVNGKLSFRELLRRVEVVSLEAFANQDVPFEKLVEELKPNRDPSYTSLFQVMFAFERAPRRGLELPGLNVRMAAVDNQTAKFDLTLDFNEMPDGIFGSIEYRTDLFEAPTIERMARHLQILLTGALAHPDWPLWQLPLLSDEERHQLTVAWNATDTILPVAKTYPELFEAQVNRTPDAPALCFQGTRWTYAELNRRANQLAHHLQRLGVGPDVLVALALQRSPEFPVAVLGTLKAGGAYLPLDLSNPPYRLAQVLADARPAVVLTQRRFAASLPAGGSVHCVDGPEWISQVARQPSGAGPASAADSGHLAYVIYTSGSTGKPKGVQITHRSLLNHNGAVARAFGLRPSDRVLQFSALCFDISVEELFPTWLQGGCVVLRTDAALDSMETFFEFVRTEQITVLDLPTAFWHTLVDRLKVQSFPPLVRLVAIGGEKASLECWQAWKQCVGDSVQLINTYGPTETTVTATWFAPDPRRDDTLPIGRPMANTQVYVLDPHGQPVPIGVAGELHIGGAGLARGYHHQPELTAEKFIPNPFSGAPGSRLYRTGDLARYRPDGNLEFVGRIDQQIKLRGFRIELEEIESVLRQHPQVQDAVVTAREGPSRDQELVAYYVSREPAAPAPEELRRFLKDKLPDYMAPSVFVALDRLPLTTSGKTDRKALPLPQSQPKPADLVLPRTPTEAALAEIWREVLGLEQISVEDNFFQLGGHSLLATQVISRLRNLGYGEASLRALFESPTIAGLSRQLDVLGKSHAGKASPSLMFRARTRACGPTATTLQLLGWIELHLMGLGG